MGTVSRGIGRSYWGLLLLFALAALLAATIGADKAQADVTWLCKPGLADDPCEIPLDTTVQDGGAGKVETPDRVAEAKRPVDCFYVYPTVSNQPTPNATKSRDPELVSIAKYQAASFSTECRIFAPIYRQITLAGIAGFAVGGDGSPSATAFSDVLEAWRDYVKNDNDGRGVVLIGHSQGSIMLRQLIRTEVEKHPDQERRLVGAVLLGGNVSVPTGNTKGGDFEQTPICTKPGQFGCVVAYSTYSTDPTPATFFGNTNTDSTSRAFGMPTGPGYEVACTDPGKLSGDDGPIGVTIPSEPFAQGPINVGIAVTNGGPPPTAPTTWVEPSARFTGSCQSINGANVFRYDPTAGSQRPNEFPPAWGTHLLDANLGIGRLRSIVHAQAAGWLASELKIGKAKRNKRRGTAKLPISVPGAGSVSLQGGGIRGAKAVTTGPQTVKLKVATRGRAHRRLVHRGRANITVQVRFQPGVGSPIGADVKVRLRLRR